MQWTGRQAVVTLPEHIEAANAGQIGEQLLSVINRGAAALIADMTATLSCDYSGADAMVRAYQRALVSGTQLRLVVTTPVVRRVLSVHGLDRLILIYPSLDAAIAAGRQPPSATGHRTSPRAGRKRPVNSSGASIMHAMAAASSAGQYGGWASSLSSR